MTESCTCEPLLSQLPLCRLHDPAFQADPASFIESVLPVALNWHDAQQKASEVQEAAQAKQEGGT